MVEIELLGKLKKYDVDTKLNVRSVPAAIRLISAQYPEFQSDIRESARHGIGYRVVVDGDEIDEETIAHPVLRKITIVPVVSGSSALGRIIGGIALIGLSTISGGVLGIASSTFLSVGIAVALGGVASLLTPTASNNNNQNSFLLDPAVGQSSQGKPVPIAYTGNPAFLLLDLLTNKRYGLGKDLEDYQIDMAAIYKIARRCDELVSDGKGGLEPRYRICVYIRDAYDAWELINAMLATIHAMPCHQGDLLSFVQDAPGETVADLYTNANTVHKRNRSGQLERPPFVYARAGLAAKHTVCTVKWVDVDNYGAQSTAYVDLSDIGLGSKMDRLGVRQMDLAPLGIISEAQARRYGRWFLATEWYEDETIAFSVGSAGLLRSVGEIAQVQDNNKSPSRAGGRLMSATINTLTLDAPANIPTATTDIQVLVDGVVLTRRILDAPGDRTTITITPDFPTIPNINAIWQIPGDTAKKYKILSVEDREDGSYSMMGLAYNDTKHAIAEILTSLSEADISNLNPPEPPTNLTITGTYRGYFLGWKPSVTTNVVSYAVQQQEIGSNNWSDIPLAAGATDIDIAVTGNIGHTFRVAAVNLYGKRSIWLESPPTYGLAGTIIAKNADGSIVLDRAVEIKSGVTYWLYTRCSNPAGPRPVNLVSPYADRRQVSTPPGVTNTLSVTPGYLGDTIAGLPAGTYNNLGTSGLSAGAVSYVSVTGANATVYNGVNLTGGSQVLTPGTYYANRNQLAGVGNDTILSLVVDAGGSVFLSQHEPGENPVDGSTWRLDTI